MTEEDLLAKLNAKRKKLITGEEVFTTEMPLNLLKKIDVFFNKGLSYYLDPKDPIKSDEESIFFRKDDFNAELSFGARQIVNKFEQDKISFAALSKLIDYKIKRIAPVYAPSDNPQRVAMEARQYLYPGFTPNKRDFLREFIGKLAGSNILVFEFVETWNKKETANINGLFLAPNTIVLKRNQKALRREIFTLAHELGHYLLNAEEIDGNISNEVKGGGKSNENDVEQWCNNFAYFFLAGDYDREIAALGKATAANDYHHDVIEAVSLKTQLSTLALYTRLWRNGTVSSSDYENISNDILEQIRKREEAEKGEMAREKQQALDEGRKPGGATPQPIISPLYLNTLRGALYSGLINERDFCTRLRIPVDKMEKYLA